MAVLLLFLFCAVPTLARDPQLHHAFVPHPTVPDRQVEYFWSAPEGDLDGEAPRPAVLLVHGHQVGDRPGARRFLRLFPSLLKAGFVVAAVSQPGYGESDGPPDFCGPVSQDAVHAVLAALRANPRIDPQRIALYGYSRGAIVSSMVATQDPALAGLILGGGIYDLEARYLTMPDDWGAKANLEKEAGTSREALLARSALLAEEPIRVPTLFIHGADDPISPVEGTRRFAARLHEAGTPVEVRVYADTAHGVPWREQEEAVVGFLGWVAGVD